MCVAGGGGEGGILLAPPQNHIPDLSLSASPLLPNQPEPSRATIISLPLQLLSHSPLSIHLPLLRETLHWLERNLRLFPPASPMSPSSTPHSLEALAMLAFFLFLHRIRDSAFAVSSALSLFILVISFMSMLTFHLTFLATLVPSHPHPFTSVGLQALTSSYLICILLCLPLPELQGSHSPIL